MSVGRSASRRSLFAMSTQSLTSFSPNSLTSWRSLRSNVGELVGESWRTSSRTKLAGERAHYFPGEGLNKVLRCREDDVSNQAHQRQQRRFRVDAAILVKLNDRVVDHVCEHRNVVVAWLV